MEVLLKRVDKTYKPKRACVYIISHPRLLDLDINILRSKILKGHSAIYIGRTSMRVGKRFTDHKATRNGKHRQLTGPFIEAHDYSFEECFALLGEGTEEEMKELEKFLRPDPNMGLNERVGG